MGRRFLLRPLGKRVNRGNKFSRQWLVQHKTYPPAQDLGVPNTSETVEEEDAVLATAGAFGPLPERDRLHIYIAQIEKVGLGSP